MRERNVTEEEILEFSQRDESHFFDNKSNAISGRSVQKIATAFANADGGEFVVGMKDAKEEADPAQRWDGVASPEHLNFVFQSLHETAPQVPHQAEFLRSPEGSLALRIYIEKSESVHRTADGSVYVRRGAQSLPLKSAEGIQSLQYAKGESSYEDTIVPGSTAEDILETEEMRAFLEAYSPATDPVDFTINQNLVDRKSYDPRTAGIREFLRKSGHPLVR